MANDNYKVTNLGGVMGKKKASELLERRLEVPTGIRRCDEIIAHYKSNPGRYFGKNKFYLDKLYSERLSLLEEKDVS